MKQIRSREETKQALEFQRQALLISGESFDKGNAWEGVRLAVATYIIVHDGGKNSRSILTQLGVRGSVRFVVSAPSANPKNLLRETPLVMTQIRGDGTAAMVPLLGNGPPYGRLPVQFHIWWERDIIFQDGHFRLNRKGLIFALRNQEGGAHFDREVTDENYVRMSREQITTPQVIFSNKPPLTLLGAELATMRQIAWELLKTLEDTPIP